MPGPQSTHDVPLPGTAPGGQPMVELSRHADADVEAVAEHTVYGGHAVQALAFGVAPYEVALQARQVGLPAGA